MLQDMRAALKPDGVIALVEFRAEDPRVPIKPLHKMSKAQIMKEQVEQLIKKKDDPALHKEWMAMKKGCKEKLAAFLKKRMDFELDTDSLIDIQIKRIHEYKRQLMNILVEPVKTEFDLSDTQMGLLAGLAFAPRAPRCSDTTSSLSVHAWPRSEATF